MSKKNTTQSNGRCPKCNNSYGHHGKSPDGVQLGKWIPCTACRPIR